MAWHLLILLLSCRGRSISGGRRCCSRRLVVRRWSSRDSWQRYRLSKLLSALQWRWGVRIRRRRRSSCLLERRHTTVKWRGYARWSWSLWRRWRRGWRTPGESSNWWAWRRHAGACLVGERGRDWRCPSTWSTASGNRWLCHHWGVIPVRHILCLWRWRWK